MELQWLLSVQCIIYNALLLKLELVSMELPRLLSVHGLVCSVLSTYMGAQDMERQSLNVFRMRLLGAEVRAVHSGTATLKDAMSDAIRDWVTNVETTHYILGSVAGPHPYSMMVREFHAVIGKETIKQALEKWGGKPDDVRLIGVAWSYEQIVEPHSISAGLDYSGVGPEHSFLKVEGHAEYCSDTDDEALEGMMLHPILHFRLHFRDSRLHCYLLFMIYNDTCLYDIHLVLL
ncbi:hypothetical protein EZV62_009184 [Acer yangbiense]|uniref:Tryptophan synthase n=1 Tax=Acer yangbiense TaxID=1000413 RepID=A0A5C7IFX9_9ROSI|nr:hypothetical protein EZV62_009001 [Acer yangbiense]TXG67909.1 hypothetical protein EZV62_009184 [Acer yangbiense]